MSRFFGIFFILSLCLFLPAAGFTGDKLFVLPEDGFVPFLQDIRQASLSVDLAGDTPYHDAVLAELSNAVKRSVKIRFLDSSPQRPAAAAKKTGDAFLKSLRAAGVVIGRLPVRFPASHQNIAVIDGKISWVSTAHYRADVLTNSRNFSLRFEDTETAGELAAMFESDWTGRRSLPGTGRLLFSPDQAREGLYEVIRNARKTLDIYNEELKDSGVMNELLRANHRRVVVRVICANLKGKYKRDLNESVKKMLNQNGMTVRTLQEPYAHARAVLADKETLWIGSQSFNPDSFAKNREVSALTRDSAAIRRFAEIFEADFSISE